ncbi:MAG: glycoside hydrolase family 3 C-terminal domain-containing protein, partial [Pseudomonadota bacterium]
GEQPYAEFAGDKRDLAFRDEEGLKLLRRYKDAGIPTVAVFLSGRPLWVNRELNAADAFVASWLPGGEGAGVADVLFGKREATGRLSFSWPATCEGSPVNGPEGALFPLGYGLSFGDATTLKELDETCSSVEVGASMDWFSSGRLGEGVTARAGSIDIPQLRGSTTLVSALGYDRDAQEDAREITFQSGGSVELAGPGESEAFRIVYEVPERPAGKVSLGSGGSTLDVTPQMAVAAGKGWREMVLTDACLPGLASTWSLGSDAAFTIRIDSISREETAAGAECSF